MPRTNIERLNDDARIWIFGISPALDEARSAAVLAQVDQFLDQWASHGTPVTSARQLLFGTFLVVAVDQQSETSGCSIDKMFGLLKHLESSLGVAILDSSRIFARDGHSDVHAYARPEFRENGDPDTIVFNTLAERLGDVRNGGWEKRAADSWHRALLSNAAVQE
jgi:hypothetical protein